MAGFPKVNQTVSGGYYMGNLDSVAEFLMDNGYSRAAAAGISGTIAGESAGDPESVGSGGAGLIGNTPPYPNEVTGNAQADFDNELSNLLQYADSNSAEAVMRGGVDLATLKQATNPVQAAQWWSAFEGPLVPGSDVRSGVANTVYNDLNGFTPGSVYTQPNKGGVLTGAPGNSGSPATAILDSFPGGGFDPLNWPSEAGRAIGGAEGSVENAIGTGIESAIKGMFGSIMSSLGFKSGKDFLIRISLILLGVAILLIGIKGLVTSGNSSSGSPVFSGASGESGDGEGSDSSGRKPSSNRRSSESAPSPSEIVEE